MGVNFVKNIKVLAVSIFRNFKEASEMINVLTSKWLVSSYKYVRTIKMLKLHSKPKKFTIVKFGTKKG